MTQNDFLAFYPQFATVTPAPVLTEYIRQANARFSDFGDDAEEARRLYTAHKVTMYFYTCLPEGSSPSREAVAAAGRGLRSNIASEKVGEVQITYANTSSVSGSASTSLADLPQTAYGLQLLSLLKLHSFARYVP